MKIAICDNHTVYLNSMHLLIKNYIHSEYKEEKADYFQFLSAKELIAWINQFGETLDILILDICLENNCNGIRLAKEITAKYPNIKIIFVTAYLEQAADISEAPFIYFVYKNKNFDSKLFAAVDKAIEICKYKNNQFIVINNQKLFTDKIESFIADKKQTRIIYKNGAEENIKSGISAIADLLPGNFVSIHRSCIVNMDCINKIIANKKIIKTLSGMNLQIARAKYNKILAAYQNYLKKGSQNVYY